VWPFLLLKLNLDVYKYTLAPCPVFRGNFKWTNPVTLQQLEYAEGDITLLQCETVEQYKAEMQRRQQFILQMAGDRDPSGYGLDDKDGRHWDKLEART
jgi:hypothetical protein